MRREEAQNNFQIKGRRYIFLKNVDHLTQQEKEALSPVEVGNPNAIPRLGTFLQVPAGSQRHFSLVKVLLSAQSPRR